MNAVHSIRVHVIRKTTAATDPADKDDLLSRDTQIGQHLLHLRQNRVVAAAWAPTYVLVRREISGFQYGGHRCILKSAGFVLRNPGRMNPVSSRFSISASTVSFAANMVFDRFDKLGHAERFALDFVDTNAIDQVFRTQQHPQLARVQFGNQNRIE